MTITQTQANYYARLWEMSQAVSNFIREFEATFESSEIKHKLPSVQVVYMHEIIISLWMILGNGSNDKYNLHKLSKVFKNKDLREKASKITSSHKDLIEKLGKNRNWISAHIDERLTGLKFSEEETKKLEQRFETSFPYMKADSKANERYTPEDMLRDLPEIKQALQNLDEIVLLIPKSFSS